MTKLRRITRYRVADVAAKRICGWISSSGLRPGARLPSEQELTEALGLSRSGVREALAHLKALGIVEIFQGRGAFVAEVPFELLRDRIRRWQEPPPDVGAQLEYIWELREIFEVAIAGLAAERRTDEDLERMEGAVAEMERTIAAGGSAVEEDAMFHYQLTRASHNPVLLQLIEDISSLIESSRRDSLSRTGRPQSSNREHAAILGAVRSRDVPRARQAMHVHLLNGQRLSSPGPVGAVEAE